MTSIAKCNPNNACSQTSKKTVACCEKNGYVKLNCYAVISLVAVRSVVIEVLKTNDKNIRKYMLPRMLE